MAIGSLGKVQGTPRNDQRSRVMGTEAIALGEFLPTNHRGVGRIAGDDLQPRVMGACFDRRCNLCVGQCREHALIAPAFGFKGGLFLGESERLDH